MKRGGFYKKTISDTPLDSTTVLLRTDYNVPMQGGEIKSDFRIRASLPTIEALLRRGCKVVIVSHLGRPDGQKNAAFSLEPVAAVLGKLLKRAVRFVPDCVGDGVKMATKRAPKNSVLLLENLRFYKEEEINDANFARRLAADSGAQYFVQDAFGAVHRAHASTSAITSCLPSVSGLLLEKEYTAIKNAVEQPNRPMVAVLGGAKISDKIRVVERFIEKADTVIVGGAMANNFLKYHRYPIGKSLVEEDVDKIIKSIYAAAQEKVGQAALDKFIIIPKDVAVSTTKSATASRLDIDRKTVKDNEMILDIGPDTMAAIDEVVSKAGTVVWNGTLGCAELPQFSYGSARLALALATRPEVTSVIGGGDTSDFVLDWDAADGNSFTHVSTGGGAALDLIGGKLLPGLESLMDG